MGLCLVGHHPILSRGGYSRGPIHNATCILWSNGPRLYRVNVPLPAHFRTRPSVAFDFYLLVNSLVITTSTDMGFRRRVLAKTAAPRVKIEAPSKLAVLAQHYDSRDPTKMNPTL